MSKTNQESDAPHMSNNDLKVKADAAYQEFAIEMKRIYDELFNSLDDEGKAELADAQKAWSIFVERQATFSSGLMRGGSAESLLYLEESNSLMRSRIASLSEALIERTAD